MKQEDLADPAGPFVALLRVLAEKLPSMLAYWDRDLRCRFANRAYERWFGVDPDALVGSHIRGLLGEQIYALNLPYIEGALRGEEQEFERELPSPGKVGSPRHAHALYIPDIVDGEVRGFCVLVTDITSRYLLDQSVTEQAQLLELAHDAILVRDAEGVIRFWNTGAEELYGYRRVEAIGAHANDLLQTKFPCPEPEIIAKLLADGRWDGELTHITRDGRVLDIETRWAVRRDGTRIASILEINRDVTERHRVEAALTSARDAAEAGTRARSEFLAMMSHEIRTPMNSIVALSGLALERGLTGAPREAVETIRDSANILVKIVNDVLDFSKIEAGHLSLELGPMSLRECVEDALAIARPQARVKDLTLAYAADEDVPPTIVTDPTRLRQILVNLVGNAVKFTRAGHVMVRASVARTAEGNLLLRLTVEDTGVGIPPDKLPKLFRAFSQADSSISRRYGGTGLGLAISQRLAVALGGEISVRSEPALGTSFVLVVPIAAGSPPAPSVVAGTRLAIVEPRPTMQAAWSSLARELGCDAAVVASLGELGPLAAFDALVVSSIVGERAALAVAIPTIVVDARAPRPDAAGTRQLSHVAEPLRRAPIESALARATGRGVADEVAAPVAAIGRRLRVLVAEDNPVNQLVARRLLEHLDHDCDVVGDGVEMLSALEVRTYDVVLVDVNMPNLDGLEATRRLRATEPPGVHTYVIAMTASAMRGDRDRCLDAGCDGYLTKPARLEDLRAALSLLPGDGAHPALEPHALARLRELGGAAGRDVLAEMLAAFASDAPGRLSALVEANTTGDTSARTRIAHALRGSGGTVGAAHLAELLAEVETAEARDATPAVAAVVAELDRVLTAIRVLVTAS